MCSVRISITRPSGARCSSLGQLAPEPRLAGRLVDAPAAGWTRSRPARTRRKLPLREVAPHDVAEEAAEHVRGLRDRRARRRDVDGVVAEVGHPQARAAAGRRWRAGWRPCAASPSGRERAQLGHEPAVGVEQLLGPVAAHPLLELLAGGRAGSRARPAAPGASARCPRSCRPSTSFGPVQPFGVRSTIIGQRGRCACAARARLGLDRARSRRAPCRASRPSAGASAAGSSPSTKYGS